MSSKMSCTSQQSTGSQSTSHRRSYDHRSSTIRQTTSKTSQSSSHSRMSLKISQSSFHEKLDRTASWKDRHQSSWDFVYTPTSPKISQSSSHSSMELQKSNNCKIILDNIRSPKQSHSHSHKNSHSSNHSVEGNLKNIKNSWESLDSSKLQTGCQSRVRKVTLDVSSSQLAAAERAEHQWESSSTGEESKRAWDGGAQPPDRADCNYRPATGSVNCYQTE